MTSDDKEFGPFLDEDRPMGHPVLRVLYLLAGLLCMVLGVVGWLVPIITGIPFYVLGAWLLGLSSRRARHGINALETKLPHGVRVRLRKWFQRSTPEASGEPQE